MIKIENLNLGKFPNEACQVLGEERYQIPVYKPSLLKLDSKSSALTCEKTAKIIESNSYFGWKAKAFDLTNLLTDGNYRTVIDAVYKSLSCNKDCDNIAAKEATEIIAVFAETNCLIVDAVCLMNNNTNIEMLLQALLPADEGERVVMLTPEDIHRVNDEFVKKLVNDAFADILQELPEGAKNLVQKEGKMQDRLNQITEDILKSQKEAVKDRVRNAIIENLLKENSCNGCDFFFDRCG